MRRFEALDSWRGLCALLVVVFHLNQDIHWSLLDAQFVHRFDRFVDFFFVLSGFVIASSYERRLGQGYGIVAFALRRFGRIYPLHLVTLAAMLAFALLRRPLVEGRFDQSLVFNGGIFDASAIFTNLTMLHGVGFENHLTWNYPSWSISAEFYTYLLFAGVWAFAARWSGTAMAALAAAAFAALIVFDAPSLSLLTFVQCSFGFALGALTWRLFSRLGDAALRREHATIAEVGAVSAVIAFVLWGNGEAWFAMPLFALVVLAFAFEQGPISAVLRTRPLLRLGELSYSIYMVHAVLIFWVWGVVGAIETRTGVRLTAQHPNGEAGDMLWGVSSAPWVGDLLMLIMLGLVLAVSGLTYACVEKPGRSWGQRASERWAVGGWRALVGGRQTQNGPA